jgi:2-polyprenyl-3-methyl-5-hydroxy-6-metoxy-1,4-benzoquinol methylase
MYMNSLQEFKNVMIERVQAFWDARPCNIRHSPQEVGSRAYFDEVETRKYFVEPHIPAFVEFEKWKDKKVLEVGCGIGTDTISFARAGAKVTAIDYSEKSLDIARKRASVYGLKIDFYKANAEELSKVVPVEDHDLVYSFGVIHHTPRPQRAVSEICKYMGPQSVFKMMVYNRYSWKV